MKATVMVAEEMTAISGWAKCGEITLGTSVKRITSVGRYWKVRMIGIDQIS